MYQSFRIDCTSAHLCRQVFSRLAQLRAPQETLSKLFDPLQHEDLSLATRPPMMHYGFAMSEDDILYFADNLRVAPPREIRDDEGLVIHRVSASNAGYKLRVRNYLLRHLRDCADVIEVTFEETVDFAHRWVLTLYSNYDKHDSERRSQYQVEGILDLVRGEIGKAFPSDGSRLAPCLAWHWDVKKCGYKCGQLLVFLIGHKLTLLLVTPLPGMNTTSGLLGRIPHGAPPLG